MQLRFELQSVYKVEGGIVKDRKRLFRREVYIRQRGLNSGKPYLLQAFKVKM